MDNHPIPQDVTGFQFRLIGNMTVKQFAYIAVGAVGAVIFFYLPLSGIFTVIKIILIPLFILGGVALAFVPIEGRPIDVMASNFLKALFAPNQFLYHRQGGQLLLSTIHIEPHIVGQAAQNMTNGPRTSTQAQRDAERRQQLSAYLNSIHQNPATDDKEAGRISSLFGNTPQPVAPMPSITTPAPAPAVTQPLPQPTQTTAPEPVASTTPTAPAVSVEQTDTMLRIQKDTEKIAEEDALLEQVNQELTRAKSEDQATGSTGPAHMKVSELESKLQEIMAAKQDLEKELQSLKAGQFAGAASVATAPTAAPPVTSPTPAPTVVKAPNGSFPSLPDVPNIMLGTVRDSSGNILPNILVEVTDKDGNPVRAFKTNQLGQFMSATPLKEGTYTISFEDGKNTYKFDSVSLTIDNQILQPLEIAAHDAREELRKALFA